MLRRHPGDVLRLVVGVAVVVVGGLSSRSLRVAQLEQDVFRLINHLPSGAVAVLRPVMWLAALPGVAALTALAALVRRGPRPALDLALAGVSASVVGEGVRRLVERGRPATLVAGVDVRAPVQTLFAYPSGHTAVAAALAAAAAPFLPRNARRGAWAVVAVIGVGRLYLGAHLPLDVIGGAGLGWALGATIHLVLGAPGGEVAADAVERWLHRAGFDPSGVRAVVSDARSSFPFLSSSSRGELFVKTVGREQRDADLLWKGWRRVLYRDLEDEAAFTTPKQQVEHEAVVSMLAEHAGARTPRVLTVGTLDDGAGILVQQTVEGARGLDSLRVDEVDDGLLRDVWRQVGRLHGAGIAHRDLKRANILVDASDRAWVVDLGFAELDATVRRRARDVAEMLASLTLTVGVKRAVKTAGDELDEESLAVAVPFLYPSALTAVTRKAMRERRGLLKELREQTASAAGVEAPEPAAVTRFGLRSVLMLAAGAFAVHVLLPQVAEFRHIRGALAGARWWLLGVAAVVSLLRYPLAAVEQSGALPSTLPLGRSSLVQLAAAYANRATPGGIGGAAVRERFLERAGFDRPVAIASIGLVQIAGAIVHTAALVVTAASLGDLSAARLRTPPRLEALLAVGLGVALAGLLATPFGRRRVLAPTRQGLGSLREVLAQPARAGMLFGGAGAVLFGYAAVLVLCLAAFGGRLAVAHVVLVYLAGSAIAAASPTPGGLGVLEAALVAGLTGIGANPGIAVSGVLSFRLLTFWLPLVPGFAAFRILRHQDII